MAVSTQEVKKIAELARIELSAAEEARFAETISAVLNYMKILNEVDTGDVEPTYQVAGLQNITRLDIVEASLLGEKLLAQMPLMKQDELVVPAVFAEAE